MTQQLVTVTEPQTYLDTSVANTPSAGTVHIVAGGDNIQTHFDAAVPGDVILLPPGVRFDVTQLVLYPKSGGIAGGWITVMKNGSLPAEGTRVTPSDAVSYSYPSIMANSVVAPIATAPGASKWRFV